MNIEQPILNFFFSNLMRIRTQALKIDLKIFLRLCHCATACLQQSCIFLLSVLILIFYTLIYILFKLFVRILDFSCNLLKVCSQIETSTRGIKTDQKRNSISTPFLLEFFFNFLEFTFYFPIRIPPREQDEIYWGFHFYPQNIILH